MALHLLLVPHATCEHGELVEGAKPAASWVPAAPRSDQAEIGRAHGDGSGHEHCDALAVRHRVPEIGVSVATASLLEIVPVEIGRDLTETRPIPLLSLAPKSSPPV
jgi:hypothetical protein